TDGVSISAATYNITDIESNGLTASAGGPVVNDGVSSVEISNDAWTNITNATVNVEYTIVPVSGGLNCEGEPVVVTLFVLPEPVLTPTLEATVCSDQTSEIVLTTVPSSVTANSFNIVGLNSNGLSASGGTPQMINGVADSEIFDDSWTNTSNT